MKRQYPDQPVVGVGIVIVDAGKLVLIKRGNEPSKGKWSIPGGHVELGENLEAAVIRETKEETCLELIGPKLNNWDKERVALIDLLLLRMGLCELLYFPTIPSKVTINEYIDIAKQYSTPQSGQFVNGVLDNILKEQVKENKIKKVDRKSEK